MDPDSNLAEQLAVAAKINAIRDSIPDDGTMTAELERLAHLSFRLAELVEALNGWIMSGGALPRAWVKGIKRPVS